MLKSASVEVPGMGAKIQPEYPLAFQYFLQPQIL